MYDSEGHSYGQLVTGSFITTMHPLLHHVLCRIFLAKHQITQVTWPPYSPDLVPCDFWLFPKLKSPLKGKRFQTISEIQENGDWEKGAYFEGDWGVIVLCTTFLVFCIFNKCLYFSYYIAGYLLDRSHTCVICILPYVSIFTQFSASVCTVIRMWKRSLENCWQIELYI